MFKIKQVRMHWGNEQQHDPRVSIVEQELLTLKGHLSLPPPPRVLDVLVWIFGFLWSVLWIIVYHFVLFLWQLYCLPFADLRILITSLVSSNFSCILSELLSSIVMSTILWFLFNHSDNLRTQYRLDNMSNIK
jgi:hypothetical protein